MTISVFNETVAAVYDDTRYLDPKAASSAIGDVLSRSVGDSAICRILDAGCGTGRLVRPVLDALRDFRCGRGREYIGIDQSESMLDYARDALGGVAAFWQSDIADFCSAHRQCYDLVVLHWVLHCCDGWMSTLGSALESIRARGCLLWLEETGDLYDAIDCAWAPDEDSSNAPLRQLFDAYWRSVHEVQRRHGLPLTDPTARIGPPVRAAAELLEARLQESGYELFASEEHRWSRYVPLRWLKEVVIGNRAFSNMRMMPDWIHAIAVTRCADFGAAFDDECSIRLKYTVRAKAARRAPARRQGHVA
ncbi:MAG: class I SAM-dependent methyltransferase [Phycisphaerales bacterium]